MKILKLSFVLFFLIFTLQCSESCKQRPILTTASIIEIYENEDFLGIVLIKRGKEPFGYALPGGHVEHWETVEEAIRREMMEEVNLELYHLKQFHVYSDPKRDPRQHSVEVTFLAKAYDKPVAGDDAKEAYVFKIDEIPWGEFAFDHEQILKDYLDNKYENQKYRQECPAEK